MLADKEPADDITENAQQADLYILSLNDEDESNDFDSNGHLETLPTLESEKEHYGNELQKVIDYCDQFKFVNTIKNVESYK